MLAVKYPNMAERFLITRLNRDPRNPTHSLADIVSKKIAGITIQEETPEEGFPDLTLALTIDYDQRLTVKTEWENVVGTQDFYYLQRAYSGDIASFKETGISGDDLILPEDERGFTRFYNFLRGFAFERASEQALLQEDHDKVKELKLEARQGWIRPLSGIKRSLAPHYVDSLVTRLHNLVTTGEEKKTPKDRVLDWIMSF